MLLESVAPINNSPLAGERGKTEAFGLFEAHRQQLLLLGRRALLTHALLHGTATADDVRRAVPLPAGVNPKAYGAVPGALAKLGVIEACGYRRTARPVGHARDVRVWRVTDVPAARRWLADHPEPPTTSDPTPTDSTFTRRCHDVLNTTGCVA